MASVNAEAVAKEVIKQASKGKLVNLQEITEKHGYSKTSARAQNAKRTKSFKKVMAPFVQRLETLRDKAERELQTRDLTEVEYESLVKSIDILTKNIQLLSGGVTEKHAIVLPSEITGKYGVDAEPKVDC